MKKGIILLMLCILPSFMFGAPPPPVVTKGGKLPMGQKSQLSKIVEGLAQKASNDALQLPQLPPERQSYSFPQEKKLWEPVPRTMEELPVVTSPSLLEEYVDNFQMNRTILPTDGEVAEILLERLNDNDYTFSSPLFTLKHVEGNSNPTYYLEIRKECQLLNRKDGKVRHVKPGDVVEIDLTNIALLPLSPKIALEAQKIRIHPNQQHLKKLHKDALLRIFNHKYAQNVEEVWPSRMDILQAMNGSLHQRNFLYPEEVFSLIGKENSFFEEADYNVSSLGAVVLVRPKKPLLIATKSGWLKVDQDYVLDLSTEEIIPMYKPKN